MSYADLGTFSFNSYPFSLDASEKIWLGGFFSWLGWVKYEMKRWNTVCVYIYIFLGEVINIERCFFVL